MMRKKHGHALVVEDDAVWSDLIAEILQDEGLEIDKATSLEGAIQLMHLHSYRVAVVDLSLGGFSYPDQQGLQVLQAIRQRNPGCVAVLLSGYATVDIAVAALRQYGALTCMQKEMFQRAQFRELVREILASAAPPATKNELNGRFSSGLEAAVPTESEKRSSNQFRVLVVDDDAGWRVLLAELVEEAGGRPQICSGLGEAWARIKRTHFDLLVVDLSLVEEKEMPRERGNLPGGGELGGLGLLRFAKAQGLPAIVVSGLFDPSFIERVYEEYKVYLYIEKQNFDRSAFLEAITTLKASQITGTPLDNLSLRERQVLELLIEGLSNQEIANRLVISNNTVKRHLKSIFAKLGVHNRANAVALATRYLKPATTR
jgi:DNA-binding NarL/FixJ family response regulator